MTVPLLLLSDAIASNTGLSRIARDLSTRIHADLSDTFRIATFGVGGYISTSSRFPFQNGSILRLDRMVPRDLPDFWIDHAGRYGDGKQQDSETDLTEREGQVRKGILLTCWNLSWTPWLSQPHLLPPDHPLRQFLLQRPQSVSLDHWNQISNPQSPSFSPQLLSRLAQFPFRRWLYCPIDGNLPDGTLGHQLAPVLQGFDRLLAYTGYGSQVIERTLEKWGGQSAVTTINSVPHLPHGLDKAVFYPRDRRLARQTFMSRVSNGVSALPLRDDQVLLCMVATNSSRKDWGLAFQTAAELLRRGRHVFLWGHTDALVPHPGLPSIHWNLPALAKQFGMEQRVVLTAERLSDEDMAQAYSACDVMLATSSEGFGYTPFEALACGLPVAGTSYAGSSEFVPPEMQAEPVAYCLENPYLIQRPLYDPEKVADLVEKLMAGYPDRARSLLDARFEWESNWEGWKKWLLEGVER